MTFVASHPFANYFVKLTKNRRGRKQWELVEGTAQATEFPSQMEGRKLLDEHCCRLACITLITHPNVTTTCS